MAPRRAPPLHTRTLMTGRGARYYVETEGLPLSLKCVAHGRARYVIGRNEVAVDEGGWLAVNENQPYTIEIASPAIVETFIVWFPRGWAEDVWRSGTTPEAALIDDPESGATKPADFFARYTPNERAVAPRARRLRAAIGAGAAGDDAWLEQELRGLLGAMFDVQHDLRRTIARLPATRAATREELWRRLNRARDFIHARCDTPVSLTDMAHVAALSPFHFQRAFRTAFGETPHDWLMACRVARAQYLLAHTALPITEVCFAIGYESPGSFSTWFQRATGAAPRAWRAAHGRRHAIRNIREVSSSPTLLPSSA